MHNAKLGDRVRVRCLRVPDSSAENLKRRKADTFEFIVGSREVVPGLSAGVQEMTPGEHKRLTLQPADAYGPVQPWLLREIPRRPLGKRAALRVGKWLTHVEPISGHRAWVRIVEIKPDSLIVDGNHPLAGKVVELDVMLVSVDPSSHANKTKQQFEMGGEG